MRFYTKDTPLSGKNLIKLPNGFWVAQNVPIGRTGMMIYGPGQTPVAVGDDGVARIEREPEDLFRPETLASFNGVPVTNNHPPGIMVTVDNWRDFAMGYALNVRRGEGAQDDLMLADLVLTDPDIIDDVRNGKRDVSSGYDNDYYEIAPGHGRQVNIVGNHVALVERGRCGPRCSIRDHASTTDCSCNKGESTMGMMFKDFVAKVKDAWKNSKDEKQLDSALAELGIAAKTTDEEGIHIHAGGKYDDQTLDNKFKTHDDAIEDHENRITDLEKPNGTTDAAFDTAVQNGVNKALKAIGLDAAVVKRLLALDARSKDDVCPECGGEGKKDGKECPECHGTGKKPGTEDDAETEEEKEKKKKEAEAKDAAVEAEEPKAKGTKDSAYLQETFSQVLAMAEIIAPGIQAPTFDSAAKPYDTVTALCGLRRQTLDQASHDSATLPLLLMANGGKPFNTKAATCDQVRTVFNAVGALKRTANNTHDGEATLAALQAGAGQPSKLSIAEVNKRNREHKWQGS